MTTDQKHRLFMQPFFEYLGQFHPLSKAFVNHHEQNCQLISIKKTKFILSPIDSNNAMYFIIKGLVRGFVREGKKDISTWFGFENQIIEAIRNPTESTNHSDEYLQAIEDCVLIRIPNRLSDIVYGNFPEANIIARKLLELSYYAASERSNLARIPTALGRYKKLELASMDMTRIPQRYLASYLGMRLETLSRIRNKVAHLPILKLA